MNQVLWILPEAIHIIILQTCKKKKKKRHFIYFFLLTHCYPHLGWKSTCNTQKKYKKILICKYKEDVFLLECIRGKICDGKCLLGKLGKEKLSLLVNSWSSFSNMYVKTNRSTENKVNKSDRCIFKHLFTLQVYLYVHTGSLYVSFLCIRPEYLLAFQSYEK